MRTAQRDQSGTITLSASVPDLPSGSGVLQPGAVPFTFTRVSAGVYEMRFDTRILPIAGSAALTTGVGFAILAVPNPGLVRVATYGSGGALTNVSFSFVVTAVDKRT